MIGNNSAGSQSVRYGMTIDHVLALDVVLSDASRSGVRPADRGRAGAAAPPRRRSTGAICRELPGLAERHRDAIATGFPRFWRQSGGYRLDRLAELTAPGSTWRSSWSAPRAPWSPSSRPPSRWCPRPRHRVDRRRPLHARCRPRSRPPRTRWPASPPPSSCSTAPSSTCPARRSSTGALGVDPARRPGGAAVRHLLRRHRGRGGRRARPAGRTLAGARPRLSHAAGRRRRRAGGAAEGPRGRASAC